MAIGKFLFNVDAKILHRGQSRHKLGVKVPVILIKMQMNLLESGKKFVVKLQKLFPGFVVANVVVHANAFQIAIRHRITLKRIDKKGGVVSGVKVKFT